MNGFKEEPIITSLKNMASDKPKELDALAVVCFDEEAEEFESWDSEAQSFMSNREYKHGDKSR